MPAYWYHAREFSKLNPGSQASAAAWTTKKAAEKLERTRLRLVTKRQTVTRKSEWEEKEIAPIWAPVPAQVLHLSGKCKMAFPTLQCRGTSLNQRGS